MKNRADLASSLRAELVAAADATRAPAMQAYMKSAMPFAGVASTPRRAIGKALFRSHPFEDARDWQRAVSKIWDQAEFREERYCAIELLLDKRYKSFLTLDVLPLIERLIVEGAWWDYVDVLAAHGIGALLRREPRKMKKTLLSWARGKDMWKRRSAILSQLSLKKETDLEFLESVIEPSLSSSEFFLRKAIGWALRQVAWTDPAWVERYVRAHRSELSPLSVREALKNVGRG